MSGITTQPAMPERPLAISLLLGMSGWAAGGFLLIFIALLFDADSAGQAAILGTLLLVAAWGLFRFDREDRQIFVVQLALALSIAGQCLVLYAMSKDADGVVPVAFAALVLQTVLALAMPNRLHRTLSTLFATIAWALTLRFTLFGEHTHIYPADGRQAASLTGALAVWLLTWAPVAAALWWAIRSETAWVVRGWAPLLRPIVTGLIVSLAFATTASYPLESIQWFGNGKAGAGNLALWPLLSSLGALGALTAAFALRQRALMAMCVVAALLHVGCFYYALGSSLLVKSLLMLAVGSLLIVAARILRPRENA